MSTRETKPLIKKTKSSTNYAKYTFLSSGSIHDLSEYEGVENKKVKKKQSVCSLICGLICIMISVFDWVLMSEIIQSSEQTNYNKPFLMRFMVNTTYSLMIIPWALVHSFNQHILCSNMVFTHWTSTNNSHSNSKSKSKSKSMTISLSPSPPLSPSSPSNKGKGELIINHNVNKLNKFHFFASAMIVNLVSLSSGYIWYLSLSETVASINNTIFQSNCVFVLIFSYFLLNEPLNFTKISAAIISIIGVGLISFSVPSNKNQNISSSSSTTNGILLCFVSMTLFAFFEVLFKYFGQKYFRFGYELSDTLLFQSSIGFTNILLFWPFIVLFHYFNLERFELPSSYDQYMNGILLPCLLDLLFTASLLCGITFCGAIFMSIGLILVIPITFFSDIIIFKKASINIINTKSVIGAICIIVGFILIQSSHSTKTNKKQTSKK